jgi:putative toxin-antitoxin system antitoxin component (TIGR02293 family)
MDLAKRLYFMSKLPYGVEMRTLSFKPSGSVNPRGAEFALLGQLLDARIHSGVDLAELASERVEVVVIDRLSAHGLKADELSFIIPRRTLAHRRQNNERLSPEESDKAIRLAKIVAQASAAFGDQEKAMYWLRSPLKRFGGKSALEMTGTEQGARLVEEALVQLDEGYFS